MSAEQRDGEGFLLDPASLTTYGNLIVKGRNALIANKAYIALPTRTQQNVADQVLALTQQVDALIKLKLSDLGDTSGT